MQSQVILTIEDKILLKNLGLLYSSKDNKCSGVLSFQSAFNGNFLPFATTECSQFIQDSYEIEIDFNNANLLPTIYNTDNRILNYSKLHKIQTADLHLKPNGSLCLCHTLQEKSFFNADTRKLNVFEFIILVIQFFYAHSYFEKNKKEPWKGYSHGFFGTIEYLSEMETFTPAFVLESIGGDKKLFSLIASTVDISKYSYEGKSIRRNKKFVKSFKKVRNSLREKLQLTSPTYKDKS